MKTPSPLFTRFFRWFCDPKLHRNIEGDLMELYHDRLKADGPRKANVKFIRDIILLFRPGIIKPLFSYQRKNRYAMFKNYFTIGWRNLKRHKGYSIINIGGLALGMAVAMLIGLWVFDELSFNTYFKNYDRIVLVNKGGKFEGRYYQGQMHLPYPLIEELSTKYKDNFKYVIPLSHSNGYKAIVAVDDKKLMRKGIFVGEGALEMFSLEMTKGDWNAFKDPKAIVISEAMAKSFFGDENPMGKTVRLDNNFDMTVGGVYKDIPKNTMLHGMEFFGTWTFYLQQNSWIKQQGWENHFLYTYAQIADGKSLEDVSAVIKKAEMKAIEHLDYMKNELQYDYDILLLPMRDWHLRSDFKEGTLQQGPVQFVWFIGTIGVFVLLLACINFMNLSTARSARRAKEVGIRKTIGSVRLHLINQFFSESFLVVVIAFVFSIILVQLALPWFNTLSGKELHIPFGEGWYWLATFGFIGITGILAGSYPALYLSSFNPVSILKGTFKVGRYAAVPRKVLVVVQFTVSVMLVVSTAVIYHQLMFVKNRPVGYTKEGLITMYKTSRDFDTKAEALRTELKNTGVVTEVGESGGDVTGTWSHNGGFTWEGKDPSFEANFATLNVSPEFGKTVGWQFTAGRDFSSDIKSDTAGFILNEAAVEYMKIKDPVGKTIHWTNRPWNADFDFHVVGVIKDMLMNSPFEPVKPAIYMTYGGEGVLLMRVAKGVSMSEALPKIQTAFSKVIPDVPFDPRFVDEDFATKFENEERIGTLALIFSTLAIIISCLGLLGLASFVAEQRTKEIGIRKVMGASVSALWQLLSREFMVLVTLSCVVACPVAYYILSEGLKNYEYKTDISWWIFATASAGALLITLATVSIHSSRAALANPVKSLRSE